MVNEFFSDDDGCIYDWNQEGADHQSSISKLSPPELRTYLPSTITISADRLITVQIRFGFFGTTPSKWRNQKSTKEKLERYKVTVAISNSTSTSGKLLIAGYILLKAPMTTHRLRYLQSLRQSLPDNTPPFDILLHKRSPVSDDVVPHLAVQCGTKHVHALSEALCSLLTGTNSALFMPRSVVADMTDDKVNEFFHQHDIYCKDLRSHPLTPLLRNLDKARKEYNPDGSLSIERTTREWARSLTDDQSKFHFDVVNGGLDQLAYLIFPSTHATLAAAHVDSYKKRLYRRRQREDQFKKDVGPPTTVHLSRRVIANLEFMERLCANKSKDKPSESNSKASEADASSSASASTTSSVTQATKPPTSLEALRELYKEKETGFDESSVQSTSEISEGSDKSEATTIASTTSGKTKDSGRMSTSSAKVRQLDEVLRRHKSDSAQVQAKQSERVSQIERQLQRVHEFDTKLDTIQTDFSSRLSLFEGRMEESMNSNMEKLLALVQHLHPQPSGTSGSNQAGEPHSSHSSTKLSDNTVIQQINHLDSEGSSTSESLSSKASVTSSVSPDPIHSPEHKKLKSAGKRSKKIKLKDPIRRRLDELQEYSATETIAMETQDDFQAAESPPESPIGITSKASFDSMEHVFQEMDDLAEHCNTSRPDFSSTANHDNPESQYNASHDMKVDNDAPSSPGCPSTP